MRKRKVVKIDEKEITVKELTVKDMLDIFSEVKKEDTSIIALRAIIEKHLDKTIDMPFADFKNMAPSEIKEVWLAFKEVNDVFFETAAAMGLTSIVAEMKKAFIKDWSNAVLSLSKQDTRSSSITGRLSSS